MLATDFTRDDCRIGNRRRSYEALQREWRCNECGGRPTVKWGESGWYIACACGGQDFIHQRELERQQHDAAVVLDGLPVELAAALGYERPTMPEHEGVYRLRVEPVEI